MRINVLNGIKDYEGNYLKDRKVDDDGNAVVQDGKVVMEKQTLRSIIITALNSTGSGEVLVAEDKAKIFALSSKLYASKNVELTLDEMVFIKDRVAKIFNSPLIYGRIQELFERNEADQTEDDSEEVAQPTEDGNEGA